MRADRINVLQVETGSRDFTGISSYLFRQYSAMDHDRIHYDFLYGRHNSMKLMSMCPTLADSDIYSLEARINGKESCDYLKILRGLRNILKEKQYDALVVNTSCVEIALAGLLAVAGTGTGLIAHAHNAGIYLTSVGVRGKHPLLMELADRVCRIIVRRRADWLFACTEAAGRFTFGKKAVRQENFRIVHNAINLESFRPDPEVRRSVREKNGGAGNTVVFGYTGRMALSKNLNFLITVFAELHRRNENSVLWMVGEGDEREKLQMQAEKLGLGKSVVFFGQRPDVNDLMQGMDAFIFPSLMEGLGMVAIEAQASGLPTVVSDGVPDDVMITPLVRKVSLKADASEWADAVLAQMDACPERKAYIEELANAGYDVRDEAMKMTEFYEQIVEQKKAGQWRKLEIRIPETEVELDSVKALSAQSR